MSIAARRAASGTEGYAAEADALFCQHDAILKQPLARLRLLCALAMLLALALAGRAFCQDMERVAPVFAALKEAAESMRPEPIEPYIEYPFTARHPGANIVLRSPRDLKREFRRLFNERVRSAIRKQKLDDAFRNYQGVMIGDGEVWIGEVCRDAQCQERRTVIRAINY